MKKILMLMLLVVAVPALSGCSAKVDVDHHAPQPEHIHVIP